jgi:hypothetical protein
MRAGAVVRVGAMTAGLAMAAMPLGAQEIVETSFKVVKGKCTESLHGGRMPRYHGCSGAVMYFEWKDGRKTIVFANGTSGFYFIGKGPGWNQKGAGRIDLSLVATGWGDSIEEFPAKGYCRFGNLHAGQKVAITCSATMAKGHWSAAFETDGKPPTEPKPKS